MTRQEAMELTRDMREAGHTWRGIADHLNEAGMSTETGSPWQLSNLFNTYKRWVADGCQTHEKQPEPRKAPKKSDVDRQPVSGAPHELLASNPAHAAALADIADRRRYFEEQRLDFKAIKRINRMYREGAKHDQTTL